MSPRNEGPPWWVIVWGINGLCLGAGFAVKAGWTGNKYVRKLAPNWEYTLGNWWSGMLLLAFAWLIAMAAFHAEALTARSRWAFRILAWLGLGLCLDELGSLHERASDVLPWPGIWSLAPFAAVFILAATWSLWTIRRDNRSLGPACLMIAAAFACMGCVEPLDMIEHAINPPAGWTPFGVVLEEGIELLGSTLLIAAAIRINRSLPVNNSPEAGAGPTLKPAASRWLGHWILAGTLPLLVLRQYLQSTDILNLHTRGDFGAAPAVMLLALIAWTYLQQARGTPGGKSWHNLVPAVLALLASVELGCNLTAWIKHESVITPLGAAWVQASAAATAYLWLIGVTRPTPAKGSTQESAA